MRCHLSVRWICTSVTLIFVVLGYPSAKGLSTYSVLVGGRAELPCDLNVTTLDDDVSLVLWHRGESGNPVYSVDARDTSLPTAKHFPAPDMQNRAYFNSSVTPAVLRIENIEKSEAGVYRCRVEYRRARTETTDMILKVIVPPVEAIIMDEFGQHLHGVIGPFNEGYPLSLACEGEGGEPSPSVLWYRGMELLDDSYSITPQGFARNELLLVRLKRSDLMTTLTCQVSNSNFSEPVTSSVTLDMNLRPTEVRITTLYRPFSAGQSSDLVCVARGARPPAQVSWWLDGEQIKSGITENSVRDENLTVSTLTLAPIPQDSHKNLSCRADNPQLPDSELEDSWILNVHHSPRLKVTLDPLGPVMERSEVTVTCSIQANPPIKSLEWLLDGRSVEKLPVLGLDQRTVQNRTLVLPAVGPENHGSYQCSASNAEGRSISEPANLRVLYSPKCESVSSRIYGVGKTESVSVTCEVNAFPAEVTFFWMLNNSYVSSSVIPTSHYSTNETKSVITVSPRTPEDYGILYCWATNTVGKQKVPCSFRIVPAGPPEEVHNCQISNRTNRCLSVDCEASENGGMNQVFHLEIYVAKNKLFFANRTTKVTPQFSVCGLPSDKSLMAVVYATNSRGKSKQVVIQVDRLDNEARDEASTANSDVTGIVSVILGIVIGAAVVSLTLCSLTLIIVKFHKRNAQEGGSLNMEIEKSDAELMKEFKISSVPNNQGPDIIPEKRFFKDRPESSLTDKAGYEEGPSTVLPKDSVSCNKYYEYQTPAYVSSSEFLAGPQTMRLHPASDGENSRHDNGVVVETPLISSIPLAAQQWTDQRKEGLRLSTPV